MQASLAEMKLEEIPSQVAKVLQFREALTQRLGVVLVGPSGLCPLLPCSNYLVAVLEDESLPWVLGFVKFVAHGSWDHA